MRFLILIFLVLWSFCSWGQFSGVVTVGLGDDDGNSGDNNFASFSGSGGLINTFNSVGISGDVTILVQTNLVEIGGSRSFNNHNSGFLINIQPDAGINKTISYNFNVGISFNNCSNINIDGSFSGGGRFLTFVNNNATGECFRLINGGQNLNFTNCNLQTDNIGIQGAIFFHQFAGTLGYDKVIIENNVFSDASGANDMRNAIEIRQPNTDGVSNSNIQIKRNRFENLLGSGVEVSTGYSTTGDVPSLLITGNHFYNTSNVAVIQSQLIRIEVGDGHSIIGNYFGGNAPFCAGGPMEVNLENSTTYRCIFIRNTVLTANEIQIDSNVIKNIKFNGSVTKSVDVELIRAYGGKCVIGVSYGNFIGDNMVDAFVNPSIECISEVDFADFTAIYTDGSAEAVKANKNKIGGIYMHSIASPTIRARLWLFRTHSAGTFPISIEENVIGSTSSPNNICKTVDGNFMVFRMDINSDVDIRENTIGGLTLNGGFGSNSWVLYRRQGVLSDLNFSKNTIGNLTVDARTNANIRVNSNSTTFTRFYPIYISQGGNNLMIESNSISGVFTSADSPTERNSFMGMYLGGLVSGSLNVIDNVIGSTTQNNNMYHTAEGSYYGVYVVTSGEGINVEKNSIAGIRCEGDFNGAIIGYQKAGSNVIDAVYRNNLFGNASVNASINPSVYVNTKRSITSYGFITRDCDNLTLFGNQIAGVSLNTQFDSLSAGFAGIYNYVSGTASSIDNNTFGSVTTSKSIYQTTRGHVYGIYEGSNARSKIDNNILDNIWMEGEIYGNLYGIYGANTSELYIIDNTIGKSTVDATVNPSIYCKSTESSLVYPILSNRNGVSKSIINNSISGIMLDYESSGNRSFARPIQINSNNSGALVINENRIGSSTVNSNIINKTNAGNLFLYVSGNHNSITINDNSIQGIKTFDEFGVGSTICIYLSNNAANTINVANNTIGNLTSDAVSSPSLEFTSSNVGSSNLYGIYINSNATNNVNITDNLLAGIKLNSTGTTSLLHFNGIYTTGSADDWLLEGNRIGSSIISKSIIQETSGNTHCMVLYAEGNSVINKNVIENISSEGASADGDFRGIFHSDPLPFDITMTKNSIGNSSVDASVNPSISLNNNISGRTTYIYGYYVRGGKDVTLSDNTFGGVQMNTINGNTNIYCYGYISGNLPFASFVKRDNVFGSTTVLNNILHQGNGLLMGMIDNGNSVTGLFETKDNVVGGLSTSGLFNRYVYGFYARHKSGSASIMHNSVRNISVDGGTGAYLYGFRHYEAGTVHLDSNEVKDITIDNERNSTAFIGYYLDPLSTGNKYSNNALDDVSFTSASALNAGMYGAVLTRAGSGGEFYGNRFSGISNKSTGSGVTRYIQNTNGSWTVYNNVLLNDLAENIYTIMIYNATSNAASNNKYYYNSVEVEGAISSGTRYQYCFYSSNNGGSLDVRNNVFNNLGTSSVNQNLALRYNSLTNLTSDHNSLNASNPARLGYFSGYRTFAGMQSSTGLDANSVNIPLNLDGTGFPVPDVAVEGYATPVSVLFDIVDTTRNLVIPDCGAYEIDYVWTGDVSSDWFDVNNWRPNRLPTVLDAVEIRNTATNFPDINNTGAVVKTIAVESGAELIMQSGSQLNVEEYFIMEGTFDPVGGTVEFDGDDCEIRGVDSIPFHNLNVLSIADTLRVNNPFHIKLKGDFMNDGTFSMASGTSFNFYDVNSQSCQNTDTWIFDKITCNKAGGFAEVSNDVNVTSAVHVIDGELGFKQNLTGPADLIVEDVGTLTLGLLGIVIPQLSGTWTFNDGLINLAGSGSQTLAAFTYPNIEISGSGDKDLDGPTFLKNTLFLTSGLFDVSTSSFTLLSTATKTARIAEITGGDITGDITMQRYIPAGETNWRMLSSATAGRTLSDWNDDFLTSGFAGSNHPSFHFISVYSYDETTLGDKDQGWIPASSITDNIEDAEGYYVWCGDNLLGTASFVVDVVGEANKGLILKPLSYTDDASQPLSQDGWNMVGNPYPSPVDFSKVNLVNTVNAYWINDPQSGNIELWDESLSISTFGLADGNIASSQGLWLHATGVGAIVLFNEDDKTDSSSPIFKASSIGVSAMGIKIRSDVNNFWDRVLVGEIQGADSLMDSYDRAKFYSPSAGAPNIATQVEGQDLAMNFYTDFNDELSIPIAIKTPGAGNYELVFDQVNQLNVGCLMLVDNIDSTYTPITDSMIYTFSSTANFDGVRFYIENTGIGFAKKVNTTCSGNMDGQLSLYGRGVGPFHYQVTDDLGNLITNVTSIDDSIVVSNLSPGNYYWSIESNSICGIIINTDSILVEQGVEILAGFEMSSDTLYLINGQANITLIDTSSMANNSNWSFGDGNFGNGSQPNHTYYNEGTYTITQTVNNNGCSDQASSEVVVINDILNSINSMDLNLTVLEINGVLKIRSEGSILGDVTVFEGSGKQVYLENSSSDNISIPVMHWAAGIYIIQLKSSEGDYQTVKWNK